MAVDRCHQVASRCPHSGIPVTGKHVRHAPAVKHSSVSRLLHLDSGRIGVFQDRLQQLDHAGAIGDRVCHREIPQKRNRLDGRVEDSQLTEPQAKITQG
ncbi:MULTISPECIES: hypothetical protein [unclassified Streptomyces]|uniref:hypothetical protein n=1 Tax=unclassified Streptomyces TaxID=2593676 RepID=UPI002E79CEB6|nr:hypothetical protein [Streptomyces sp. JV184]